MFYQICMVSKLFVTSKSVAGTSIGFVARSYIRDCCNFCAQFICQSGVMKVLNKVIRFHELCQPLLEQLSSTQW